MACRLCDRFWEEFWESSETWESDHSNDSDLLSRESRRSWELIQQASALEETDSAAAFQLYLEAAEAGSAWAMRAVAWRYWTGTGVPADPVLAEDFYRRAIGGGSWMATIHYARLLNEHQRYDEREQLLKDGVEANFIPAFFWLARFRYDGSQSREMARAIGPLLEHAAGEGHPGAKQMLARLMLGGKLGLGRIPKGLLMAFKQALDYAARQSRRGPAK